MPPDLPPAGVSPDRWAEYLQRYDRYLELEARRVDQGAEYNRLMAETVRLQDDAQRQQRDQAAFQQGQVEHTRRVGRWLMVGLAVLVAGLIAFAVYMESRKAARSSTARELLDGR